jgi:hypothetical protein
MIDLVLEIIPPKLFAFLIAVAFVAAGVYIWMGGSDRRREYDRAVGEGSKTYQAEVRWKVVRRESTSGINDHDSGSADVNYLHLGYEENGEYQSIEARVSREEYDKVNENDKMMISFHPDNPGFVVTPMKERPGVFWHRAGGGILILLGVIFVLMILVSLVG